MSILYDYLKVLEKKKGEPAVESWAPERKKNKFSSFSFIIGFILLLSIFILVFSLRGIKNSVPIAGQKINKIQESAKPVTQDSISSSLSNTYGANFFLKGIIYNSDYPSAIINDNLVGKNAKIGDWLVIDISPAQVILENSKNNSQLILKLGSIFEVKTN